MLFMCFLYPLNMHVLPSCGTKLLNRGLCIVIPVAITAIYISKQGVSDLGNTQAHVSFRL